jgi:hypothetical protein
LTGGQEVGSSNLPSPTQKCSSDGMRIRAAVGLPSLPRESTPDSRRFTRPQRLRRLLVRRHGPVSANDRHRQDLWITITTESAYADQSSVLRGPRRKTDPPPRPGQAQTGLFCQVALHEAAQDRAVLRRQARITCPPASAALFGDVNGDHDPYSPSLPLRRRQPTKWRRRPDEAADSNE